MTATAFLGEVEQSSSNSLEQRGEAPTLAEIQAIFQQAVLTQDTSILEHICDSSRTGRNVLLGVYQNAYFLRLVEVVRSDHPLLASYLGDEAFDDMARAYIAQHPSRTPNARWVANGLPEFLETVPPYSEHPEIHELAQLEFALNIAFDASDEPVIDLASLGSFPPESWGALQFVPHPSAQRIDFASNAADIWLALKSDEEPPQVTKGETTDRLIAWREGVMPKFRRLSAEEAMMWDEAAKGAAFGALCELCAVFDDPDNAPLRAASYLNSWLSSGMLSEAALCEPA